MRRKLKNVMIIVIIVGITIPFSLMMTNAIVLTRIHYKIVYEVETDNPDALIDHVENLDYPSLIKHHDGLGEIHNLTNYYSEGHFNTHYFDREYVEALKEEVRSDSKRFHWWLGHYHYFNYLLNVTEETNIYFTYNNNTMIGAQYGNHEDIFIVESDYSSKERVGNWYINFTQVPNVVNQTSISLNNTLLVKMTLKYDYLFGNVGGIFYEVEQFLVLDNKFNVIFIYIPLVWVAVA